MGQANRPMSWVKEQNRKAKMGLGVTQVSGQVSRQRQDQKQTRFSTRFTGKGIVRSNPGQQGVSEQVSGQRQKQIRSAVRFT